MSQDGDMSYNPFLPAAGNLSEELDTPDDPGTSSYNSLVEVLTRALDNSNNERHQGLRAPARFNGKEQQQCYPFVEHCELIFEQRPREYSKGPAKVKYAASFLIEDAQEWYAHLLRNKDPCLADWSLFKQEFTNSFSDKQEENRAFNRLMTILMDRNETVTRYSTRFRSDLYRLDVNDSTARHLYKRGLSPDLQQALGLMNPIIDNLNDLISAALRAERSILDAKYATSRRREQESSAPSSSSKPAGGRVKPSGKSGGRVSADELERRTNLGLCRYDGSSEHTLINCPNRPNRDNDQKIKREGSSGRPSFPNAVKPTLKAEGSAKKE